jgi:hypothetical protein
MVSKNLMFQEEKGKVEVGRIKKEILIGSINRNIKENIVYKWSD